MYFSWSQPMDPWTSAAAYKRAAAQSMRWCSNRAFTWRTAVPVSRDSKLLSETLEAIYSLQKKEKNPIHTYAQRWVLPWPACLPDLNHLVFNLWVQLNMGFYCTYFWWRHVVPWIKIQKTDFERTNKQSNRFALVNMCVWNIFPSFIARNPLHKLVKYFRISLQKYPKIQGIGLQVSNNSDFNRRESWYTHFMQIYINSYHQGLDFDDLKIL